MPVEMAPQYDPKQVEDRLYAWWERSGFFHAKTEDALAERERAAREGRAPKIFSLVIPPPNITGILTVGHILDNTPQDIMVRLRRMQGNVTTWVPGTDHAGIATQSVVVKALAKDKIRKEDLGREKFVEKVWEWRNEYGHRIIGQLKKLGYSCDWERTRFTMDEGCSRAVTEIFCRLYEAGLISRGDYIVNWCPKCLTALSDEEVERSERSGSLWHLRYPRTDGSGHVIVATTRPETMLGDTAVAVHPGDTRYTGLVGKTVTLPLQNRPIPVIADSYVDPKFGTGAVKVTPAHDPNDFAIRQRHPEIDIIGVMTDDAHMSAAAGAAYAGLKREECRKKVVADLEAAGLLEKIEPHTLSIGQCYRCDTVIEPRKSLQWYVKMGPLAGPALQAARTGEMKFFPERWVNTYTHWMENIRDWCISRQLWWGHRIPVWYCGPCGGRVPASSLQDGATEDRTSTRDPRGGVSGDRPVPAPTGSAPVPAGLIVSRTPPKSCPTCGRADGLRQDPDVLDTWFSSWLWPFSTLGWPDETPDLKAFYPTTWLNSGKDILFFWDARMIMAGLFATGKLPFPHLYLHGIARDAQGRKISKSLGNSPDPLALIEKYSADAIRFGIIANTPLGADVNLAEKIYELGRNFCNKLWNASRFVLQACEKVAAGRRARDAARLGAGFFGPRAFEDLWIRHRFTAALSAYNDQLNRYEFGEAAQTLYHFFWDDFCDWYLELIKPRLYRECATDAEFADQGAAAREAMMLLESTLKLLHPLVPFVTEEVWQHVRQFWKEQEEALAGAGAGRSSPVSGSSPAIARRPIPDVAPVAEAGPRPPGPPRETIMFGPWPSLTDVTFEHDPEVEETMTRLQEIVRGVRDIRNKMILKPQQPLTVVLSAPDEEAREMLEGHRTLLATHGRLDPLTIGVKAARPPRSATAVAGPIEIYVVLGDLVDWTKERARLENALAKARAAEAQVSGKLSNADFKAHAPAAVVSAEEARLAEVRDQIRTMEGSLREVAEWGKG
ncbi:MAG: valine--tRNA ligase [Planctomycetes bacterium]|nr:valine--tRNA ligase [Planctomycetota bacterium]